MPITTEDFHSSLYDLLRTKGYQPIPLDSKGKTSPFYPEADIFKFSFVKDGKKYGDVWATVDNGLKLVLYYDDEVSSSPSSNTKGVEVGDSWPALLKHLKRWAQRRQLGFELKNKDHLVSDMQQREYMRKKEQLGEGYYPMGKKASYTDAIPQVKIVIQHSKQLGEGEQRFRHVEKIFVENTEGERFAVPTKKPGLAKIYARHVAEGGTPYDDRGRHLTSLIEEYSKMVGFMRATKNGEFSEAVQPVVEAGRNHFTSLRETLSKLVGHRGYHTYFDSWTPVLNEEQGDENIATLFTKQQLDPRIASCIPILSKIARVDESKPVKELDNWADEMISETTGLEMPPPKNPKNVTYRDKKAALKHYGAELSQHRAGKEKEAALAHYKNQLKHDEGVAEGASERKASERAERAWNRGKRGEDFIKRFGQSEFDRLTKKSSERAERAWNGGVSDEDFIKQFGKSEFDRLTKKYGDGSIPVPDLHGYTPREPTDPKVRLHRGLDGPGAQLKAIIKKVNDQGVAEGKYDPAKDTFNPETHTAITKDGVDKIIPKGQLAQYKTKGWKERHSLKAFHKNREKQGVAEGRDKGNGAESLWKHYVKPALKRRDIKGPFKTTLEFENFLSHVSPPGPMADLLPDIFFNADQQKRKAILQSINNYIKHDTGSMSETSFKGVAEGLLNEDPLLIKNLTKQLYSFFTQKKLPVTIHTNWDGQVFPGTGQVSSKGEIGSSVAPILILTSKTGDIIAVRYYRETIVDALKAAGNRGAHYRDKAEINALLNTWSNEIKRIIPDTMEVAFQDEDKFGFYTMWIRMKTTKKGGYVQPGAQKPAAPATGTAPATPQQKVAETETHESLNPQQKKVGQLGPLEKAKNISPVLGKKEKQHPFQGKLVGASESIDPELKRIKNLLKHNKE